jgi:valyl-tRNA synthetase
MGPELPKQYRPSDHEGRIRLGWEASGAFHPDPARVLGEGGGGSGGEARGARPYAIVIPPPNVTDRLHLGHALNNTLQDVLARAHRMMGYETLWMPGTDHAGIATQAVVERRLRKEGSLKGPLKEAMTREAFVAKVQAFKDEYEATITGQLKAMGCSCDWERQRFTMDEQCTRAVYEAFFRLFRDGLIYRGKRLVNWDPVLQTAVADDETEDVEVQGFMYYLRYPLVHARGAATMRELARGQSGPGDAVPVTWSELRARGWPAQMDAEHDDEKQAWVTVATTRPETYLGDTAVAVNPRDPRAKALRGLSVELPLVGRIIPVIEDDYVVMPASLRADPEAAEGDTKAAIATGFLKVTPGHDPNDFAIGERHKLGVINVLAPDGSISDRHGWTDVGGAHIFIGKPREEARKLVVREFQDRTVGGDPGAVKLFAKSVAYTHSVPHSDRSKAAIEPYLSDQWYVRVTDPRLRDAALAAMAPEQRTGTPPPADEKWATGGSLAVGGAGVPPAAGTPVPRRYWDNAPVGSGFRGSARRLPHFQHGDRTYFITYRTARGELSPQERKIALEACTHFHGQRAIVYLALVMPDHVHMLIQPLEKGDGTRYQLGELMHSIKSFSAHAINKLRGATGAVWQDEWYDRIMRDGGEFEEKWNYIWDNPYRAGIVKKPDMYPFWSSPSEVDRKERTEARRVPGGGRDARPTSSQRPDADGDGGLRFFPARYAKTFESWHENIRDWCISRQLWWGHRIPVWSKYVGTFKEHHGEPGSDLDVFTDELSLLQVEEESVVVRYVSATDPSRFLSLLNGEVERAKDLLVYVCAKSPRVRCSISGREYDMDPWLGAHGFERDPDVLDTWFSSALWPMSTMGWPEATDLLATFNPTSTLCTAREIITLWVSRMVMFNRYFMPAGWPAQKELAEQGEGKGPLPFRDVFIHAMIQDGEGRKMSKSLGNGVDPLDIISSHGADAMRFVLCQMTTQTQDVRMPVEPDPVTKKNTSPKFDVGRNFCNKLWNAARFAIGILEAPSPTQDPGPRTQDSTRPLADRWMLSRLLASGRAINCAIEDYQFADYATALYDLLWRDFCDWYLEAIKPTVGSDPAQRAVLAHTLEAIVRILHPIAPYITEAIWERLRDIETEPLPGITLGPARTGGLLATAGWPVLESALSDPQAEALFARIQAVTTAIREVRAQHNVPPKRRITLHWPPALQDNLAEGLDLVRTLAGLDSITTSAPTGPSVPFSAEGVECRLSNLAEAMDAGAERIRLERVIADSERTIKTLEARLANPGYAQKAPPAMVQQTRDQLAKASADREAALTAMKGLG